MTTTGSPPPQAFEVTVVVSSTGWMYSNCTQEFCHAPHVSPGLPSQSQPNARVAAPPVALALALSESIRFLEYPGGATGAVDPSQHERSTTAARLRWTRRGQPTHADDGGARRAEMHLGKQVRSDPHRGQGWSCLRERAGGRTRRCAATPSGGTPRGLAPRAVPLSPGCVSDPSLCARHLSGPPLDAAVGVAVLNRLLHSARLNAVCPAGASRDRPATGSFVRIRVHATTPSRHNVLRLLRRFSRPHKSEHLHTAGVCGSSPSRPMNPRVWVNSFLRFNTVLSTVRRFKVSICGQLLVRRAGRDTTALGTDHCGYPTDPYALLVVRLGNRRKVYR